MLQCRLATVDMMSVTRSLMFIDMEQRAQTMLSIRHASELAEISTGIFIAPIMTFFFRWASPMHG
ncbi:hypothetical protein LZ30DRAFT_717659 [Colletotrichum cereale]|nr:hypothetical protein LZ30DRAFT_717659 [Colletotrichum cereale]